MAALFPIPGGSIIYIASPFLVVVLGLVIGYVELSGYNLGYSKFASSNKLGVPSKVGMFLMYFPADQIASAFLAYGIGFLPELLNCCGASGVASLLESAVATSDTRLLLVVAAVFTNFSKRTLEGMDTIIGCSPNFGRMAARNMLYHRVASLAYLYAPTTSLN